MLKRKGIAALQVKISSDGVEPYHSPQVRTKNA